MIYKFINPRHICLIAAINNYMKPSAIIESIDKNYWNMFADFLEKLDILYCYRSDKGIVVWNRDFYEIRDEKFRKIYEIECRLHPKINASYEVSNILISKDINTLKNLFKIFSNKSIGNRDLILGKLLGYPDCCIKNFIKRGPVFSRHYFHLDIIRRGLEYNVPVEFWAIYHTPCSVECRYSIEMGKNYIKSLKKLSNDIYHKVLSLLKSSYLAYSVGNRYISFKTVKSNITEYNDFIKRYLSNNVKVVLGEIIQPFVYSNYRNHDNLLLLNREIVGIKVIAFAPGIGCLVFDPKNNREYIRISKSIIEKYGKLDTVFRVYSSES